MKENDTVQAGPRGQDQSPLDGVHDEHAHAWQRASFTRMVAIATMQQKSTWMAPQSKMAPLVWNYPSFHPSMSKTKKISPCFIPVRDITKEKITVRLTDLHAFYFKKVRQHSISFI